MSIIRNHINFSANFVQIPNEWMRDGRLSHRARGLLAEVMTHSDGWEITVQHLIRNGTEGRDAVRAAIKELADHGYLRQERVQDESGRMLGSQYVIQVPPEDHEVVSRGADFQGPGKPTPGKTATKNTNPIEDQRKNPGAGAPSSSGYADEFEAWWKLYPSTANKAGAYKAYKAAAKKHDNLDGKLRAYLNARNVQERSGKFVPAIPNASTWLNQERWNDYGEVVTITRNNGQRVPEWSKAECDSILGGEDHWVPGSPPPGLSIPEEREWKQARAAEHLDERRQKAWEVMNSDRSAA